MDHISQRRLLSKLAKVDTTGMKHTQKLTAFAKALGIKDQTALMGGLKQQEKAAKTTRPQPVSFDEKIKVLYAAALKDDDLNAHLQEEWQSSVRRGYTTESFEAFAESRMHGMLSECGHTEANLKTFASDADDETLEDISARLANEGDGQGFAFMWAAYGAQEVEDAYTPIWEAQGVLDIEQRKVFVRTIRDLVETAYARHVRGPDQQSVPRDDALEATAQMNSDDYIIDEIVDIRAYLAKMSAEDYAAIVADEFGSGYGTDAIFHALEWKEPGAKRLSDYLSLRPKMMTGDTVGFSVNVDQGQAEAWLAKHRPEILGEPIIAVFTGVNDDETFKADVRPFLATASDDLVSAFIEQQQVDQLVDYAGRVFPRVRQMIADSDVMRLMLREQGADSSMAHVTAQLHEDAYDAAIAWTQMCRPHLISADDLTI